jgi:hypothetical protein
MMPERSPRSFFLSFFLSFFTWLMSARPRTLTDQLGIFDTRTPFSRRNFLFLCVRESAYDLSPPAYRSIELLIKDQEEQRKAEFDKDRADAMLAKLEEEKNAKRVRLVSLHASTLASSPSPSSASASPSSASASTTSSSEVVGRRMSLTI